VSVLLTVAALATLLALAVLAGRLAPEPSARLLIALQRVHARLRERRAEIPGFVMPYLEGGQGEVVLLLHGFGADKDHFARVARYLVPHYRVIAPDLPGFGAASRDPRASYLMARQAERVRQFMDALGIARVHLGGSSMGGFIASELAARWPERVLSLWLLDAAGTAAATGTPVVQEYLKSGEVPLVVRSRAHFDVLLKLATHRPVFLPHAVREALVRRALADAPLHARIYRELAVESPPLEQRGTPIDVPTLIVWGEEDRILSPAAAATQLHLHPRGRLLRMAGIGHLPMLEAPRRSATALLAFLGELPQGRSASSRTKR
jgi:pimeloyl-ACP methyl ester carboxylesterase